MLTLKIVGAIIALGAGIWFGLPGRFDQSTEDIQRTMELGIGHRKKVKRHFTPLAWISRQISVRRGGPARRGGFRMEDPEDR